jgi:hypothetical protein
MKKINLIILSMTLLIVILLANFSSGEASYCCERLINEGAWCQSSLFNQCSTGLNPFSNQNYRNVPTSCESTSYCKLGTCINSLDGTCMPNTPLAVCDRDDGLWKPEGIADLSECKLGCCLIGNNQAAFVTLVRCKKLTSEQNQGLIVNYRPDITSEAECIASVSSDAKGACVFTQENQKNCLMITQRECSDMKENAEEGVDTTTISFHEGYLCSAPQLGTSCGPRGGTKCEDEKVYFADTCGNTANVYDYSKLNDNDYWTYIQEPSCDDGSGNKNSATCGACDYYSGSICKAYVRGETSKPSYGNSICKTLDCTYDSNNNGHIEDNEHYLHGETWCQENGNTATLENTMTYSIVKNNTAIPPGKRYFRMLCYNGDVTVEPCAEFRNEMCVQQEVNDYSVARCVINRWQDCTNQTEKKVCEDSDMRDCKWIEGYSMRKDTDGHDLGFTDYATNATTGSCVPKYAPGFDFWQGEGNGPEWCSQGTTTCVVVYEKGLIDFNGAECVDNCECIKGNSGYNAWLNNLNEVCTSLGDCGNKKNYFGYYGEEKDPITTS